jgi:uncharacterized damage-inducible protein DinB
MNPQFLVGQLRFARREMLRCLEGVSPEDAVIRVQPMNCISWVVGHLAQQEQYFWVYAAQQKALYPELYRQVGFGQPASTPTYVEMQRAWRDITACADEYLDRLTPELLLTYFEPDGNRSPENVGTLLLRNITHYWFHTGEAHAMRQQLGHLDLPQFVGNIPGLVDGQ